MPHTEHIDPLLLPAMVVMGVSGAGKSTIGEALAHRLSLPFIDADSLHPQSNIAKMTSGQALNDEDRWPWLAQVGKTMAEAARHSGNVVCACSALKRDYRRAIADQLRRPVIFILLSGDADLIRQRQANRPGHFMPASLLDSQFALLEPFGTDELSMTVDNSVGPGEVIETILARLYRLSTV